MKIHFNSVTLFNKTADSKYAQQNFIHVTHKNYLCVLEVMPPQWSDLILAADIPHCKADVFVLNSFNVET